MNTGNTQTAGASHRRVRPLALAAALAALTLAVQAQQPEPGTFSTSATPVFAIKGFTVTGENPLGEGETSRVLAPFLRSDATLETLQKATTALETALRVKGYGLHRVSLPPQDVGDTVTLTIVKFVINKIAIEGRSLYDEGNIRRSLPELREGHTPNFRRMAIQTAIANENPNKQVQVGLREADEPDKIDAAITVKESRPWTFGLSLSNAGTPSSGRDRFTVTGGHTNLFNLDHQFVGAYTTSLERMADVKQLGLSYRIPFYALGGVMGISYTRSDVVGNFGAFTSTGAGHTAGLLYTHYMPANGGYRSFVSFALDDKLFSAARINDVTVPGALARRSRPFTLGYNARMESDTAFWGYNFDFAFNTSGGRGNDLLSYVSEDPRVQTTQWKALRGSINYSAPFGGAWLWGVRSQFQYSRDVMISGEQFGLGGLLSVRGTPERPLSGDRGLSASFEVTTPELGEGLRAVGFVDAGALANNSPDGGAKPSSDRIASMGLGLRYAHPSGLSISADYGRIVKGSRVPLAINSAAPQKGDEKLYLNISVRF
ncbi:MAG: ShlB/FhaC/HecB family hemolysin secretion/activation protein [Burkholderiaceae bacterium]|nr:ShlB/FhaC/HecB family hemolysin secretion/activation protein [Burkholderiaceae bacterium]